MTVIAFDRDPAEAANNAAQYGVAFEEASTVFSDSLTLSMPNPGGQYEARWVTMGEAARGRLVLVVHT